MPDGGFVLPPRWTPLRYHETQQKYWTSPHRFNTLPCGRRSGKTELAKRKLVKRAISATTIWAPRFFAAAPTRDQAKRIYWEDLKLLCPPDLIVKISESELMIRLVNYAELWVLGMDKPERVEGQPWDGGVLDEVANMKAHAWPAHVRPALADRMGWCDLIGVPEGRNHYYELDKAARANMMKYGERSEWGAYHWVSADILSKEEIEANKRDLDEQTFDQEFNASFINFEGRVYYAFDERTHCIPCRKFYNPKAPLLFIFDFNVAPGVAAVAQEYLMQGRIVTLIIGEVYIPRNSNTPAVCRKLIKDWGILGPEGKPHTGLIRCYGDATGGNDGTAKVLGSDWDLIKKELRQGFGDRVQYRVKQQNPRVRARVNALNSRLRNTKGEIALFIDADAAPHIVQDLEGVVYLKGGGGDIDKSDSERTHYTDGVGYYCDYEYPVADKEMQRVEIGGV